MGNVAGQRQPRPRIGLLLHSTDVFNPAAKDASEAAWRQYFKELVDSGSIAPDSLILGRVHNPWEITDVANKFAVAQVDLIVMGNVAFVNGHTFPTLATHPNLAKTPIVAVADPETHPTEWSTNGWCGVIMQNFVAKQLGRPLVALPGPANSPAFRSEFSKLLKVAATIKGLRSDYLCRFGDGPSGFHSATGDQLAFWNTFGTRIDSVDLSAVLDVQRKGQAKGYLGTSSFTDADVAATAEQAMSGRKVEVDKDMVLRSARLYHAYRAIIRANGYTSAALRCWPENHEDFIGVNACLIVSLLMGNGDVTAAGCESDWPTAVAQTIGTLLSGKPAACLDWVNYTPGSEIIQLGHCGVGICGQMAPNPRDGAGCACDAIAYNPVLRQAGKQTGPVHIGQFAYGPKTGLCLVRGTDNKFRLLCFRGESSPETAKGWAYAATDVRVADPKKLSRLILQYGFPHHLAVAMADVSTEVRMLCEYLGVEFVSPDE